MISQDTVNVSVDASKIMQLMSCHLQLINNQQDQEQKLTDHEWLSKVISL